MNFQNQGYAIHHKLKFSQTDHFNCTKQLPDFYSLHQAPLKVLHKIVCGMKFLKVTSVVKKVPVQ